VHISPLFRAIERLLAFKIVKSALAGHFFASILQVRQAARIEDRVTKQSMGIIAPGDANPALSRLALPRSSARYELEQVLGIFDGELPYAARSTWIKLE
jgi:hypothetical protein